jgi:hypothetical protein
MDWDCVVDDGDGALALPWQVGSSRQAQVGFAIFWGTLMTMVETMVEAAPKANAAPRKGRRFYIGLAVLMAVISVVGFWQKFFGPLLTTGESPLAPVVQFHGAIYTGWVLLFATQVFLVSVGRTRLHRKVGGFGIYYGLALIPVGALAAFHRFYNQLAAGIELAQAQVKLLEPLTDITVFTSFFISAIVYRGKPEIHKRLMIVATTTLMVAPVSRLSNVFFLHNSVVPYKVGYFSIWFLPIVAAMAYDYIKRRAISPIYPLGLVAFVILAQRKHLATTDTWTDIATWFASFASFAN